MPDQRQRFRITQTVRGRRYLLAHRSRIQEIAQYVSLAGLREVIDFPSKRDSPPTA